jgi:hypothetical protein
MLPLPPQWFAPDAADVDATEPSRKEMRGKMRRDRGPVALQGRSASSGGGRADGCALGGKSERATERGPAAGRGRGERETRGRKGRAQGQERSGT